MRNSVGASYFCPAPEPRLFLRVGARASGCSCCVSWVSEATEKEAWASAAAGGEQAAAGRASAAPCAQRAEAQAARGGARPRGGGGIGSDPAVGGECICACAAGPAPLLPLGARGGV